MNYDHHVYEHEQTSIFRVAQEHFYERLRGQRVLDIGNGGEPPRRVAGEGVASSLKLFVGVDSSPAMIRRTPDDYPKVIATGARLPFQDKSFDYVLLNGVLHHLGVCRGDGLFSKAQDFLKEVARVTRKEIIVHEIILPRAWERLEELAVNLRGGMPTFVFSERTIDRILAREGLSRKETVIKSLAALTRPFYWALVVMHWPWFRVPAFLSPLANCFFMIPCGGDRISGGNNAAKK